MNRSTPSMHKPRRYRLRDGFLSIAIVLGSLAVVILGDARWANISA